MRSNIQQDAL